MAFLDIRNVAVRGIAACVPLAREDNKEYPLFNSGEYDNFYATTGIRYRHIAATDVCASDLCYKAAQNLINGLNWNPESIDCLIFVSQTSDYILPATACILQHRLGLSTNCMAFDISLGCSGWTYGLNVMSSLLSHGMMRRGLLLVGDTLSRTNSRQDKIAWPLFGDAGSATALEYEEGAPIIYTHVATDGSGANAIMMPDGGYRNGISEESLKIYTDSEGNQRSRLNGIMDGMDVFSFAITKVPKSIKLLMDHVQLSLNDIDYLVMHQGNQMMDEMIAKKIKIEQTKVLYSLEQYGNTSGASIPLTIAANLHETSIDNTYRVLTTGFGVGLSWSTIVLTLNHIYCPKVLVY